MGYPMSWDRVLKRNGLEGGYDGTGEQVAQIAGDLRRWESDIRDDHHVCHLADLAGVTPIQVRTILDAVLKGAPNRGPWLDGKPNVCQSTYCSIKARYDAPGGDVS